MEINKKHIAIAAGLTATILSLGLIGANTFGTVFAQSTNTSTSQLHRGRPGMFGKNVQRTVTNLNNGVQITMTSADQTIVTKLQAMKQPAHRNNSNVTVTQTNIQNGIQITMTSTDQATITKLQQHQQHPRFNRSPSVPSTNSSSQQ